MASTEILRKDLNGHIISKNNKDYHISFKENIDIINVISYKKYNLYRENEFLDDNFDEDMEERKEIESDKEDEDEVDAQENKTKHNFIDDYKKADVEYFSNKDPNSFSKGGCHIF